MIRDALPEPEFSDRAGDLHCEEVDLAAVADAVGTPVYVYSQSLMQRRFQALADALAPLGARICYAVKANSNLAVIRTFADLGAGADVVSEGELRRALAAGVAPAAIVFSGVAKSRAELGFALRAGIGQINVESEDELDQLAELADHAPRPVRIAFRVNPDIDAGTHPKITTGRAENKFGVALTRVPDLFAKAGRLKGIEATAIAFHIGSQMLDLAPIDRACRRLADLVRALRAEGHRIEHIDLGGGIGVPYQGEAPVDLVEYAAIIGRTVGPLGASLTVEPGRYLTAEAGVLLGRVLVVKPGLARVAVIQDAAMNDLIRPTLYEAYHPIWPVRARGEAPTILADVVGPVCESGDFFAQARHMPRPEVGDLVAVGLAGAYSAVMSSTYNSRLLVPEVLVRKSAWAVIRPRQSYDALLAQDRMPAWR